MAARRPTRRSRRPFRVPPRSLPPSLPASPPFRPHTRSTEATPLMVNRCRYGGRSTLSLHSFLPPSLPFHSQNRPTPPPTDVLRYYDTTQPAFPPFVPPFLLSFGSGFSERAPSLPRASGAVAALPHRPRNPHFRTQPEKRSSMSVFLQTPKGFHVSFLHLIFYLMPRRKIFSMGYTGPEIITSHELCETG